jgi:6-phosphogluconolactonase
MTFQPEIHRHADFDALARSLSAWTQALLAAGIATRGQASLVVPGGRTPAPWFDLLSQADLAWDRVRVTLTDERWVDAANPASNERLVRERLLRDKAAAAVLAGLRNDAATAAEGAPAAWQALAAIARPFDLVVLGMGEDGHFASLFPGDAASLRGLDATLSPGCVAVGAPAEPRERISLNLAALLQARHLALLVTGARKLALIDEQQSGAGEALPVRALLQQRVAPLSIWWSP